MQVREIKIALGVNTQSESDSYLPRWIEYCEKYNIDYKIVDCTNNDIVKELSDCDALLWHWNHNDYRFQLFARQLTQSLDRDDFIVYPNVNSVWHFDDKVGQKYLLEVVDAPLVKSYVFYDKKSAIEWIESTTFPKVFKLRNGAGAHNVLLLKNKNSAKRYVNRAFGKGFKPYHRSSVLRDKLWFFKKDKTLTNFINIFKGVYRYAIPHPINRELPLQRNYIYAQDFIPNCEYDIRTVIIGHRGFIKKRFVREGDFRASGSTLTTWDVEEEYRNKCLKIAFETTEKLGMQSVAFDFVVDDKENIEMVEISYVAQKRTFRGYQGYWDRDLNWHEMGDMFVEDCIFEDVLSALDRENECVNRNFTPTH